MFLLLLQCIFSKVNSQNVEILVGFYNKMSNPMLSQSLPMNNLSIIDTTKIRYSLFENKIYLGTIDLNSETKKYVFNLSSILISETEYQSLKDFITPDTYFKVYVNGHIKQLKLLDQTSNQELYMFNKFRITISDKFSHKNPLFLVKEDDSVLLKPNAQVNTSFIIYVSHFDEKISISNLYNYAFFLIFIAASISLGFLYKYYLSKIPPIHKKYVKDVWTFNIFFNNYVLSLALSLNFAMTIIISSLLWTHTKRDFNIILNFGILFLVISSNIRVWILNFSNKMFFFGEDQSLGIMFVALSYIPFPLCSLVCYILFQSQTGFHIIETAILFVSSMIIAPLVISGSSFLAKYIDIRLNFYPPLGVNFESSYPGKMGAVLNTILGFFLFLIMKPMVDHCKHVVFDDEYFDPIFILTLSLTYIVMSAIISVHKVTSKLAKNNNCWQNGHFVFHLIPCSFLIIYSLIDLIFVRKYLCNFQSGFYYCALVSTFVMLACAIGSGISFLIALTFVITLSIKGKFTTDKQINYEALDVNA